MGRITPRDAALLAEVAEGRFYLREQLQGLFFNKLQGPQKAQERLRKLCLAKQLRRRRIGSQGGYVYYSNPWSEKYNHWLVLNWVYVALTTQAKSWQKVSVFKREYVFGNLRADALACVDNIVKKERQIFFIEADNATHPFVDKYRKVAESLEFSLNHPWWYAGGFPRVLVVTNRLSKIGESVLGSPVKYCLTTLDDVRQDVYACLRR
ncbi:MAG: hypothetical protein A4E53_01162 [Pelotomaculum sp. PtaB.Bin104]|nr:MAG: hypothetical protein A4E53_01162 [Pelotomaculum sp. PtaB.Bin104]